MHSSFNLSLSSSKTPTPGHSTEGYTRTWQEGDNKLIEFQHARKPFRSTGVRIVPHKTGKVQCNLNRQIIPQ